MVGGSITDILGVDLEQGPYQNADRVVARMHALGSAGRFQNKPVLRQAADDFMDEPGLAEAGRADDHSRLSTAGGGFSDGRVERSHFVLAADQPA